jgi:uncharacterized protein YkwD
MKLSHMAKMLLAAQTLLVWAAVSSVGPAGAMEDPPLGPAVSLTVASGPDRGGSAVSLPLSQASTAESGPTQDVVELINDARWVNGHLPPLKRDGGLGAASSYHSQDMALDNYFAHDSYNRVGGNLVWERPWYERVIDYYGGGWLGECIAAGFNTPDSVVQAWLNSPGHRAILLSSAYWEIGVGYYTGAGQYGTYWTTDYGRRQQVYPVVINREAATTDRRDASLYVYGQDWATQMRFRNEAGAWSAWLPYSPDRPWVLSCGAGTKTVYAEISNGSEAHTASDSIWLEGKEHELAVGADRVTFLYSMETGQMTPGPSWDAPIEDAGVACEGLPWEATRTDDWFDLAPTIGTAPSPLTITPENFQTSVPRTYAGAAIVTDLYNPGDPSQDISVQLVVTERVHQVFIPLVAQGG